MRYFSSVYLQNKTRERIFLSVHISMLLTGVIYGVFLFLTMNYSFSIYFILKNDLQINTNISVILFTLASIILATEIVPTVLSTYLIFSCQLSTKFWVKKAW